MIRTFGALLLLPLLALPVAAVAMEDVEERIRDVVAGLAPGANVDRIEETPVEGLYSVVVGGEVVYVTGDGNYLLQGELVDIDEQRSLTEEVRAGIRQERLADLDESGMLIYEPSGEVRHEVTVFTDIDCPYCRRFHAHMDELLERGIRVRYLLMPRAGRDSASYDKAVNAWCAEDPQSALTRAKQGERLAEQDCDHPVDEHLRLARELGVRGTPTLYTGEGRMLSGYRTPDELESALDGG